MAPEEEDEALSTLRLMPSAESIVSVAEKIGITSAPLQIQVINKYFSILFWLSYNLPFTTNCDLLMI